ncbi:hypothetical protein, partial [Trueperella sp.]|uniref:hypothetical protein n=1 Tax=Trueperella sp. TaxID=2699835 RepID=UPI0026296149
AWMSPSTGAIASAHSGSITSLNAMPQRYTADDAGRGSRPRTADDAVRRLPPLYRRDLAAMSALRWTPQVWTVT